MMGEEPLIAFIVFRSGHVKSYYEWGGICNEGTSEPTVQGISILFHKVVKSA